jgi:general L-amino acid transport system substrate-binding protein
LAATRATFTKPDDHLILPEIISKEPLGPVVRHGDDQWADIVRWTVFALIAAEEHGVTAANADAMASKKTPATARLLGSEGTLGDMIGLDKDFAKRAIKAKGNYAEIFERNVGTKTPIGLARGLNAHYTNGGLQYSPPFR